MSELCHRCGEATAIADTHLPGGHRASLCYDCVTLLQHWMENEEASDG